MSTTWHIGGDVGGTFTDLIAWSPDRAAVLVKTPSTLENQADGLMHGIAEAIPAEDLAGIVEVLHGTTVATNAIIERRGALTGLVTTAGFRDVLELGRRTRPQVYGLRGSFEPHVPRWLRFEVPGRLNRHGVEQLPLDETATREAGRALRDAGVQSVAVVLLHSYANREHEDQVLAWLADELPDVPITLSADVLPEVREFERTVATVLNAYVTPNLSEYLGDLGQRVGEVTTDARVRVMQGNGGTLPVAALTGFPIRSVISGPAAGLTGAARVLSELGISSAVACDMGGTSFDVGVIEDGRPLTTNELELEYNVPIRIPTLDVRTVGAGGGSIAELDDGGLLRVGPRSAGSVPGPIWYGKGGTRFTVTDANVLAGRLRATQLGTDLAPPVSKDQIWATVQQHQPELTAAFPSPGLLADAVLRVVVATMASCVRDVTIQSGRDPRDYAIISYGGAGPLHACEIARELGVRTVVVPASPGLLSAYGCLIADLATDEIISARSALQDLDTATLGVAIQRSVARMSENLTGVEGMPTSVRALYECQFERQTHAVYVEAPLDPDPAAIEAAFLAQYRELFGGLLPSSAVMVRSVRLEARTPRRAAAGFSLGDVRTTNVAVPPDVEHWRPALADDAVVRGPTTISAPDATLFLPPDTTATVSTGGHILIEVHA
ncbi:hydantoinase/oxoprolinase family protein [Patulibacter sp.]|uniref:hydantoinase/oxoprolinase family protein n=1 Tax=Patulibacter sp. TaxID=1912859 RepID=UPI002717D3A1|nr:hydantoinase/oxoprolinase family protein [Patulibacter sp.]MDO9409008.1 hydantoinase/oxoprolinase family protein [Patulibacter sp.]